MERKFGTAVDGMSSMSSYDEEALPKTISGDTEILPEINEQQEDEIFSKTIQKASVDDEN